MARRRTPRHSSQSFRRLLTAADGGSAVEFALLFPVLILLLFGTIQFSTVFYTYNSLQSAARDVSRQIAINYLSVSEAQSEVASRVPSWASEGISVTVTQTNPSDPSVNEITVAVSLSASDATPVPILLSLFSSWNLDATVTMKQEELF